MLGRIRKLWRKDDGVVALEMALLAFPLFTLIMGIVETSLFFTAGAVLEGASADAARLIRTGQVQTSVDPEETFAEKLCDEAVALLKCDDIQYEVIRIEPNTFSDAENYETEFDEDGNMVPGAFSTGNSNDIVLVRAAYKYEFLTPFLGAMMTGDPNKNWLMHVSTVVIKAEPYDFGEE